MKNKVFLFFLILILVLAGATAFLWNGYQSFLKQPLGLGQQLSVEKGTSAYKLGKKWQKEGVFSNFYYYQLLLKLHPELKAIKAGDYQIDSDMTAKAILEKLVEGKVISYQFSIIEGSNIYELLNSLTMADNIKREVAGVFEDYDKTWQALDFTGKDYPEGMFYADTFQFTKQDSDLDILQRSQAKLEQVLAEEWQKRAENLPYKTPYEALIMASIIEKETAVAAERPMIAGVFVRRLQKGMRLQTDPTIIYGLLPSFDGDIKRKDIFNPHPWNTYVHHGLPPTPIAMVGREAIHAALHPEDGKALYFVAKGDGSHKFSATLAEHNRAVRKYQLKR